MCCESYECDTSIFLNEDGKCYFLNCSKNAQFCKNLDEKMTVLNKLEDLKDKIYKVGIDRSAKKIETKRETVMNTNIIQPSVLFLIIDFA